MGELVIVVVEDEPEVRAAIVRDLAPLAGAVRVDEADTADDARAAMDEAAAGGDRVGLVLADHRLPGESGVDLLVWIHDQPTLQATRSILITGQAGHDDTIRAINHAGLDWYFAKPWDPEELVAVITQQLTTFVIEAGLDPLRYVASLDGPRLLEHYAQHTRPD
ncbi:MAG: response regulator [Ilumatobacter sp.]|jgi:two-component system, OmpR family, phosphate regulon response regulator PhoB|uniref:response regulator n=1 Tax=Ilumatobacter sp. TaxID=1967498 RepID=UPI00391BC792